MSNDGDPENGFMQVIKMFTFTWRKHPDFAGKARGQEHQKHTFFDEYKSNCASVRKEKDCITPCQSDPSYRVS